jgi:hypothetical protein
MTINLNEHMQKKQQEKHIKAYDTIGKAVDGMTIGTILHILASFTAAVLSNMDPVQRMQAAKTFYVMISTEPRQPDEPLQ